MEKKFQVFISSTFKDLADERQEVIQALLELDCIPVGMELFPAADDDQWTLIKRLIDDCDYYILIVGGRYGSLSSTGHSYTQMEYEYALSKAIPIISFLPKDPGSIHASKIELDPSQQVKLAEFKVVVQKKLCRYWESPVELGSLVSRSLIRLIKDKPQPGWVRASHLPSEDTSNEILQLRKYIDDLKQELSEAKTSIPEGTEDLSQGDDLVDVTYTVLGDFDDELYANSWNDGTVLQYTRSVKTTWNEIFFNISPLLLNEISETTFIDTLNKLIKKKANEEMIKELASAGRYPRNFVIVEDDFQTIKLQLRALGLITECDDHRRLEAIERYWRLTTYGDNVMTRLRAVRKTDN